MTSTINNYEYSYRHSFAYHHHQYLLSPLMQMLKEASSYNSNIKILNIG